MALDTRSAPPTIAMVAGEASGDLLAGLLLAGLQARWPQLRAHGIGGPQMQAHGFTAWWPHHKLSVHGFGWDVLLRYREIVGIRKQLQQRLLAQRPDLFIGIDAPDFNLDLEAGLKAQGVKTVHFVCPSVWAWRAERLLKIRRCVDHVLCIFPFEPELLAAHGIASTYVGHPLANVIPMQPDRAQARRALGLDLQDEVVALLPGSRVSEITHLAPRFFEAARRIAKVRPLVRFVVPAAPGLLERIQSIASDIGGVQRLQIVAGQSHTVLAACDVTLIASGTATLEAACFGLPYTLVYNVSWPTYVVAKLVVRIKHLGIINILAKREVVKELVQHDLNPDTLAKATADLLTQKDRREALQADLATVVAMLGSGGAYQRAAQAVHSAIHSS